MILNRFLFVYRGSPNGVERDPLSRIPGAGSPVGIGDVNGDGFGDVVLVDRQDAVVLYGGHNGLSLARRTVLLAPKTLVWHRDQVNRLSATGASNPALFDRFEARFWRQAKCSSR